MFWGALDLIVQFLVFTFDSCIKYSDHSLD
jgi:hypothetical protein